MTEVTAADGVDLRRRWLVITLATVVVQFAYCPIVGSLGTREDGATAVQTGLLAFGLALVPFALMVLAFGSKHDDAAMATLKGMGWFLLVALPLVVVVDPLVGTVAGLAAGGQSALRRDEVHSSRWRWYAVGALTVYLFVLRVVALEFAIVSGAVLPFTILGLVDQAAETR